MKLKVKAVVFAVLTLTVLLGAVVFDIPDNSGFYSVAAMANRDADRISLSPGGIVFGVKYFTKGALVVGITDIETAQGLACPAREAGLEIKDIITSIGNKEIKSA